jgi:uncharacterized caspase-like protein
MRAARLCLLIFWALMCSASASLAEGKVALVVGMKSYQFAPPLTNPVNDANAIAAVLEAIGFTIVPVMDGDTRTLRSKLREFSALSEDATIALVYYAGHGIEVDGVNYLVPVDMKVEAEADLFELTKAEDMVAAAALASKLSVVILDACRDNPFSRSLSESFESRSMAVGRGIVKIDETKVPGNTLIAYATSAGNVALDGDGANSPFAVALQQHLGEQGKDIRMVFGSVRDSVMSMTNKKQEPWTSGSLGGDVMSLNAGDGDVDESAFTAAIDPDLSTDAQIVPLDENGAKPIATEFAVWQDAKQSRKWTKVIALAKTLPDTAYGAVARAMLEMKADDASLAVEDALALLEYKDLREALDQEPVVRSVQTKLAEASYYGGEVDGFYGERTEAALTGFAEGVLKHPSVSYLTLLSLAELSDTQNVTESLSGRWAGKYYYPYALEGVLSVDFEMDLVLSQGRVSGFVSEPNTFGDDTSNHLYADFQGEIYGDSISWTKTYDGTAGVDHSVSYSGTIDRQSKTIFGTWMIRDDWSGRFSIQLMR